MLPFKEGFKGCFAKMLIRYLEELKPLTAKHSRSKRMFPAAFELTEMLLKFVWKTNSRTILSL